MSGIGLITGFTFNTNSPPDHRMRVNTLADLLNIPMEIRWNGMTVFVQDLPSRLNPKYYQLSGNVNVNPIHNDNWKLVGEVDLSNYYNKGEIDNKLAGLINLLGNYTIVDNSFPLTGGSGLNSSIKKGDAFTIAAPGGIINNRNYQGGDIIYAIINNPGNLNANWGAIETNWPYVPFDVANIRQSLAEASPNTVLSTLAVAQLLSLYQSLDGLIQDITNPANIAANKYPSSQAVFTAINQLENKLIQIDNIDANFSPVLADLCRWKRFTGATNRTITLPSDATLNLPIGFKMYFSQAGTGIVSFVAGNGATVNVADNATRLRTRHSPGTILKVDLNTWLVIGDVAL